MDSRESSPFDTSIASEDSMATLTQLEGMSLRSTPTLSTTTVQHRRRPHVVQQSRPYRILAPEESNALFAAQSSQASNEASASKRRTSTKLLKRKSKKDGSIPSLFPSTITHISAPALPLTPQGRQVCPLPRPIPSSWTIVSSLTHSLTSPSRVCCPSCDAAIGKRLSVPGFSGVESGDSSFVLGSKGEEDTTRKTSSSSSHKEVSSPIQSLPSFRLQSSNSEDGGISSMASSVISAKNKDEEMARLSFLSSSTGYSSARSSLRSSGDDSPSDLPSIGHAQSGSLRAELLSRGHISQLDRICIELLDTERSFVVDLSDVIQGYLNFLISHRDSLGVTVDDVSATFGCIERIFALNRSLYHQLDAAQLNAVKMCEVFVENASRFDDYVTYCTSYQKMMSTLVSISRRPSVSNALRERQSSLGHALPLSAYLLKPVQRILKYHLFIENILRELEASRADNESIKMVKKALEEMTAQAARMNDEKKRSEHTERVAQLQRALSEWRSEQSSDLSAYGELILEATFRLAGTKTTRQLFLFEEMLLVAKQRNNQFIAKDFIMCSNLMLNESVSPDPLAFQVLSFDSPRAQYVFLAANTEQKRTWMRELKRAVLDHFEVVIPEETKRLMLSMDNTQVKVPFGRPEFAEVNIKKKIPKYLEKRRKSVDSRDRRRSLSTSRLAHSTSQASMQSPPPLSNGVKCTCGEAGMSTSRVLSTSIIDFNASAPTTSSSSSFSIFGRKKSEPTTAVSRSRFFVARKQRQLPPSGRECLETPRCDLNPSAPAESRMMQDEIERSFDEIYRNLQIFGAEPILPNKEEAGRRLDRLVKGMSEERNATDMRLRSKSLTRLDEVTAMIDDEKRMERFENVGGWQPTEKQQRIRKSRNLQNPAPLARFDHFDSPFDSSPSPSPFASSHPPYSARSLHSSSRNGLSCARQRSPLSPEQCRMIDTTMIVPDLGIVREMINQIERA